MLKHGELGHWRRWAVLLTLHRLGGTASTHLIANRTNTNGWRVWSEPRKWTEEARRALLACEANGQVERKQYLNTEITWSLTELGRDLVETHLIGNHHITPEKFLEAANPAAEK